MVCPTSPELIPLHDKPSSGTRPKTQLSNGATPALSCRCLESASANLEEWETIKHDSGRKWIDSLLALQKRTIGQCNYVLDCKRCSSSSSSMMLPLLMCEQVVSSFQLISDGNVTLARRRQQHGQLSLGPPNSTEKRQLGISHGFVGEYEIESTHEWRHIVWVLIKHQLKNLYGLLSRLREQALTAGWSPQLTKAVCLEERLREVMANCELANLSTESLNDHDRSTADIHQSLALV